MIALTAPSSTDPLLAQIAKLLDDLWCGIHARVGVASNEMLKELNQSGLTVPQLMALHMLQHVKTCTMGDIADRTSLSKPATSQMVDRLVTMGHIVREEDTRDRRQKRLTLSAGARAMLNELRVGKLAHTAKGMEIFSEGLRRRLVEVLRDALAELQRAERTAQMEQNR